MSNTDITNAKPWKPFEFANQINPIKTLEIRCKTHEYLVAILFILILTLKSAILFHKPHPLTVFPLRQHIFAID